MRARLLAPVIGLALFGAATGVATAAPADQATVAAVPPIGAPGDVSRIRPVSVATVNGWTYQYFRNEAYPCSISGYQTFTVATRQGSEPGQAAPLWVYMHGGGKGYFDANGVPQPDTKHMTEETAGGQRNKIQSGALTQRVVASSPTARVLAVSMCDRDVYGGVGLADPNNPNTTPDGRTRTTNGLFATKAAVQFATGRYPTDDYFLYGASAGSAGTFHVAWGLQRQGLPPTGIVADSGLLNLEWQEAQHEPGCVDEAATEGIRLRIHPAITTAGNSPHSLVAAGALTVPLVHVWTINDGDCAADPMACPLPDGSTRVMNSLDCVHEPMRLAIVAQGAQTRSKTMRLCVSVPGAPRPCTNHMPTLDPDAVNTLPGQPADFNGAILRWLAQRALDD